VPRALSRSLKPKFRPISHDDLAGSQSRPGAGKTTALVYNGGTEQRGPQNVNGGHTLMAQATLWQLPKSSATPSLRRYFPSPRTKKPPPSLRSRRHNESLALPEPRGGLQRLWNVA